MRKYNVLVTATFLVLFVVVIIIMIGEMTPTASNDKKGEAVTETDAEGGVATIEWTVFEPIETEVEETVAEKDSAENAPKMDEGTATETEAEKTYSDDDLLYLAKVVENEAGAPYCTDEHQQYVASVVLNRVNSPRFPGDTILEIALCGYGDGQPIQYDYSLYGGGVEGFNSIEPSERAIENARYVLEHGVVDDTVIWQANFEQGCEVVKMFTYEFAIPPTTYICR